MTVITKPINMFITSHSYPSLYFCMVKAKISYQLLITPFMLYMRLTLYNCFFIFFHLNLSISFFYLCPNKFF